MSKERTVATECPYCNSKNNVVFENIRGTQEIINCDPDEGGCDKSYVALIALVPEITIFKLVEGSINV